MHPAHVEGPNAWERFARFFGTSKYIVLQTVIVLIWITLNSLALVNHWDPYPFILLNLVFSTQAAYAAPILQLAANASNARDQVRDGLDYKHNQLTLQLVHDLHRVNPLLTTPDLPVD